MAVELQVLGWAGVLALVQLVLFAVPANLEIGSAWLAGPRDDAPPARLSARAARLQRAFLNHLEGLVMITPAILVVTLGGASSTLTEAAASLYLVARLVYVPIYAMGIAWVRSAVWGAGFVATLALYLLALV
ncbi:MAG: MAPEG family protein [Paracoccaceae bacterium]